MSPGAPPLRRSNPSSPLSSPRFQRRYLHDDTGTCNFISFPSTNFATPCELCLASPAIPSIRILLASRCRIAVVLSFRSPIKARGSNYMYGADGGTVEIDLSVFCERRDSTDRPTRGFREREVKAGLKIGHDKAPGPLARLRSSHTWAGQSRHISEATGPARLIPTAEVCLFWLLATGSWLLLKNHQNSRTQTQQPKRGRLGNREGVANRIQRILLVNTERGKHSRRSKCILYMRRSRACPIAIVRAAEAQTG